MGEGVEKPVLFLWCLTEKFKTTEQPITSHAGHQLLDKLAKPKRILG